MVWAFGNEPNVVGLVSLHCNSKPRVDTSAGIPALETESKEAPIPNTPCLSIWDCVPDITGLIHDFLTSLEFLNASI